MDQLIQFQVQESIPIEEDEINKGDSDSESNNEAAVPSYWQSAIFRKKNQLMVQRVKKRSSDYVNLRRGFVNGTRNFEKHIDVVGIYKKNYEWSVMDDAREEAFRVFTAAVARRNGGDLNIKYGWYGGSREQIREILYPRVWPWFIGMNVDGLFSIQQVITVSY
ncbi:hypothetical protein L2E82_09093 [Cichorium intybus]|uniref:Uncharacterized protein n=1 Tax=Cichorium intybus TaxID=13427 RepID=A0ACB9G7H6_CICIN|nr:hypothetical protein L2E82_09093 [Cichorium intybus]